jgi:hypothetical protein
MRPRKTSKRLPLRERVSSRLEDNDKEHNRALDAIVVILCLFFASFFIYRFWADMNQRMIKSNEQPVGTITYKKKAAQRRFVDRVLWDRLQRESPVYNGDVIRTADVSQASITFNTSGRQMINLSENSLIQIFADENGPRVDFSEGDISVDSSQGGIALVSGGKTVNISEGGIVSVSAGVKGFNVAVAAGDARLVNEDGTVAVASAGSGIFYNPDGTIAAGPRTLVYAPMPGSKMITGENRPLSVTFSWNTANYTAGMATRIEFASDRGFRNITSTRDFASVGQAELQVPVGMTYWRAYPVLPNGENNLANAFTGTLSVLYSPPPRLVRPLPDTTVTYRNVLPPIRYQWSGTNDPLSYRLVIADNPAMTAPAVTTDVRGNVQMVAELGEGTWYWRVEPVFHQDIIGVPAVSSVSSFKIVHTPGDIPPPSLLLPNSNSIVSIAPNGPDSPFSWKGDDEAVSFNVVISRNADLSSPVINTAVANNYYNYAVKNPLLQSGSYYWAVTQTDSTGVVSPLSEIRRFQTSFFADDAKSFPAPAIVSPAEGSRIASVSTVSTVSSGSSGSSGSSSEVSVEFRWRPVSGADRYLFKLYRAGQEAFPVYETETAGALSVSVPVTPGSYTWTIQAAGKTRNEGLEWYGNSAEHRFMARDVNFVNLVSPARGATIAGIDAVRSGVSVYWTTTETLRSSRFILSTNPNPLQGTPIMDVQNPVAPLTLPRLGEGTYYWTILAETEDNYTASARSPARFQVSAVVTPPVVLVSPANGAEISTEDVRKAGVIRWTSAETPARSRFVLSRNRNPLDGTPILDIQNPSEMINLPILEPGDYFWTVTGTTREGFSISARTPSMFRILPTPPLPAVKYLLPANGVTLQPEELREKRKIVFAWEPVQGANEYVFTLWKDGAVREILLSSSPTSATSIVFDDLNKLAENGVFIWGVTAQYRNANGRIERTGLSGESRFTVNIPRPGHGQAYPPGVTYSR